VFVFFLVAKEIDGSDGLLRMRRACSNKQKFFPPTTGLKILEDLKTVRDLKTG